ncbi:MAG: hypothetical protein J7549_19535 [Variovorax sp.]|nr:hypothetical protein [Variovorax sp.]
MLAGVPAHADWQKATNEHFVFYADMKPERLQQLADRLERFDAAMRLITQARETRPVTIYMVRNMDEVERLAGQHGVGGFYRGDAQEPLIVVPARTEEGLERFDFDEMSVLQHEYAHHMLLSNLDKFLPAWATEGMAEFFSTAAHNRDGTLVLGATPTIRGFDLMLGNRWTARELLMSETRRVPSNDIGQRYARGWLLVHYLLLSGERSGQYGAYIDALNAGTPTEAAATQVFGDLGDLESDMQRYLKRRNYRGLELGPDQLKDLKPVAVAPLAPGAAAIMPYRITSAIGVDQTTAGPLAAKAAPVAARYPDDPFVQRALAEMQYDAENLDETIAAADRAVAAEPGNVMAMVYHGRAVATRAKEQDSSELWREARSWFLRANRTDPNHPQPFISYYDSFGAAGEMPNESAKTGLRRALVLTPQDDSLHLRLAVLMLREGHLQDARKQLAPAAFDPHAGETNPARDAVRMIDEGASAEAILAEFGAKLDANEFADPPDEEDGEGA